MADWDRPWLNIYPPRLRAPISPCGPDLVTTWRRAASACPEREAILGDGWAINYSRIDAAARGVAAWLTEQNVGHGDRVAICLQNDPPWLVVLIGCWWVGAVAVPTNPMYTQRELRAQVIDSGAVVLVCEAAHADEAASALAGSDVRALLLTGRLDPASPEAPPVRYAGSADICRSLLSDVVSVARDDAEPAPVSTEDPALLVYTSGTSGPSKGAILTHGNLSHNAEVYRRVFELSCNDIILGVSPLFHVTGLVGHVAATIVSRCSLVLFHRFQPEVALSLAEQHRATFTIGSPTVFIALLDSAGVRTRDLSSLRHVAAGGSPVTASLAERFEAATGRRLHTVYGLTETTSPSHATPPGLRAPLDGNGALSVGLPVPGADVRVVDPETRAPVAPGDVGELVISGPMVSPGYHEKPEATKRAMPNGWLHTGDVGWMNTDGWFFVIDRLKDQINASGFKVWPREVEEVLAEHPSIRESAVLGVPDAYRGETVVAVVSLRPGASADADELIEHCRARLAAFKCPRRISIVPELPKTASGKVLRRKLRQGDAYDPSDP